MALNDIFTMIKADKYTQDGREELIKAQQAETEDKTYKPGDISERTGKQKQLDGSWKFPKQAGKKALQKQASMMESEPFAQEEEAESKESSGTTKMTAEQKSKWEAKAANSSETKASLRNFISSMSKPEAKVNPHADEIVEIYKKELAKRENNPGYRPEKVYSNTSFESKPAEFKIQGMTKEQYIPWAMEAYKIPEWEAKSNWAHGEELQKNKMKEKEYDGIPSYDDFDPLRDSAPRVLTGDCKIRIRK